MLMGADGWPSAGDLQGGLCGALHAIQLDARKKRCVHELRPCAPWTCTPSSLPHPAAPPLARSAENVLKLSELCRKYETEQEKVLPFYVPQQVRVRVCVCLCVCVCVCVRARTHPCAPTLSWAGFVSVWARRGLS